MENNREDMNQFNRIEILIRCIKTVYPFLRVTQIIGNVVDQTDPYYVEDSDLETALVNFCRDQRVGFPQTISLLHPQDDE